MSRAASEIAASRWRNRGTIGGSLAHAIRPDLPTVLLALDGEVTARGPNGEPHDRRGGTVPDYLTPRSRTTRDHRGPAARARGYGFGYQKFTRRAEDWAMVGVCALVSRAADGTCDDVRIGLTNMSATPLRATAAEDALRGGQLDDGSIAAAAGQAADGTDPPGDLNATPDYKRHLARGSRAERSSRQ